MTITIKPAFALFSLFCLFPICQACASNSNSVNDNRMTQDECQEFCEEEYSDNLNDTDNCIACAVTCEFAVDSESYTCVWEDCNADLCAAQCEGTEFPTGLCNQVVDDQIYWGCNCFAQS
jgi:hypothetical protein